MVLPFARTIGWPSPVCCLKWRQLAAATMNEQQRMEFGRFDTLTGNASGVFGHQMVGDRLYTSAVDNTVRLWDLRSLQVMVGSFAVDCVAVARARECVQ